ncbi:MAG: DUF1236 domain-containing protein [Hyphomicrobiales bacterium]|nr:DUF1236 domain-containing protein [Hyphomicrobiales bacterium]
MRKAFYLAAFVVAFPLAVQAQGVFGGAARGAENGGRVAGPPGAVVGGAVGAVTGGVAGLLGIDQRPRFRQYVVQEHVPSYRWGGRVAVGETLPVEGVTFYEVPAEYGVHGYRYTVINGEPVLVDPHTRRIVEVVQ